MSDTIEVDAPLRGEWVATQTPAERVPSHGTDFLGQRYAFDFIRTDAKSDLPYRSGFLRHLFARLPASSFLCWDEPVASVAEGTVETVGEGWPDQHGINLLGGLLGALFSAPDVSTDVRPLAGNYVVVRGEKAVAFYAHLRAGSITVRKGQTVRTGEMIGRVGNSGNSSMPHLHFHLMDRVELHGAEGLPCAFRRYERLHGQVWEPVGSGIPGRLERVRFIERE